MSQPLRLLFIEDNQNDVDLTVRHLTRQGFEVIYERIEDLISLRRLLAHGSWDLILSDYHLPGFSVLHVLALLSELESDIPLIVLSGAVREESATETMRLGAADFFIKGNLSRFVPSIQRELSEKAARRHLRLALEERSRIESLLTLVMDLTGDCFWEWDLKTDRLNWGPNFARLTGESPKLLLPTIATWKNRIHPIDRIQVEKELAEIIAVSAYQWSGIYRFLGEKNKYLTISGRCYNYRDSLGKSVRIIGAMSDITERQRLLYRQRIFTSFADQSSESIAIVDPATGRFIEFNRTAHVTLGYSAEEFALLTVFDIDCGTSPDVIHQRLSRSSPIRTEKLITRHRTRDNKIRDVAVRSEPIILEQGTCLATVWLDITDQNLIEAQLRQSQKMDMLGQLAGGIAHDFNNVLTAMRLEVEVATFDQHADPSFSGFLCHLSPLIDRASNLTASLLKLSRKQISDRQVINLSVALADLLTVCQRLFPSAILIKPVLSSFSLLATVDPSIMDQIFMNLFVNARDAMSSGGSLTVESALIETIPGTVLPPGIIRHGRFARFTITDTGCGMSDETLQRLQEPFFTTKPIGKGTGIGLSSVRRSIEVHGGWMTVQSTIGIGSTFIVILPLDVSI